MDAILLCMKKSGIRFFSKIKFKNTNVVKFNKKENFMALVKSRDIHYDNVLIMAHGSTNAILTTSNSGKPFHIYISSNEVGAFKNDFVFAVSCLTANEFGKACINQGAIAYLGYQVEISKLFNFSPSAKSRMPKRVVIAFDTIIKQIFVNSLAISYEKFLKTPISVSVLREHFSFSLEKSISQLSEMTPQQIFDKYGVKITLQNYNFFFPNCILQTLSFLDDILPRLVCLGDENFISPTFISYQISEGIPAFQLISELKANCSFQKIANPYYKQFLVDTILAAQEVQVI